MLPDLKAKLKSYVDEFNAADNEMYSQFIGNSDAYEYLSANAPLLDCPDKDIERTYYFRWWTLRKHWKQTPVGHILTEFLSPVSWSGPYNSINCAVGHHLREARWLRDDGEWLWEYIRFWLDGHGNAQAYSSWLADALESCFQLRPNAELMHEFLPKLDALYRRREAAQLRPCGLFWSSDDRDGMEYSISGPGIRPSINSYMCGNARAIARMAEKSGMEKLAEAYRCRAAKLEEAMERLLWNGDFYRTIPCAAEDIADWIQRPDIPANNNVRELIGYLPWYFHIPGPEHDGAFRQLLDTKGFASRRGLTTAEQRHPRFMFRTEHECLWNGCVWPYATSQTLTAAANVIRDRGSAAPISNDDYFSMLLAYARSHRLEDEAGNVRCWIDENMDPYTGRWISRDELWRDHWNPARGGKERGKDYNHSTFCDLVLSGLLGINRKEGNICAEPIIPSDWDHFMVTGITHENWTVIYDRDGSKYGCGAGLRVFRQ